MPFLKQQIQLINNQLQNGVLSDARFAGAKLEAIAVDVSRRNDAGRIETFPAIMSSNFEAREIIVDDSYPLIIYHKILGKTYVAERSATGDGNKNIIERVDARMVVYGKYAKIKLTAEQLEALITTGFPDVIGRNKLTDLKLDSMTVTLQNTVLNGAAVFQEEYKGFELFLGAEDILFSVKYNIESRFRKGCFTICDCDTDA